ncbi:MAG: UDP-N-acetylmuramoyl-tripeptide--D-alanyl-D-alanine ligase [Gemmatimonadota bacterium]
MSARPWTEAAVCAALGLGAPEEDGLAHGAVSTDTRTLAEGDLFVALRGERHDGHDHLADAAAAGATGAVVERLPDGAPGTLRYYRVDSTLAALGRLGRCRRRVVGARVCVVAGSNGKTTTKDLLRAVLGARYRVHATTGNLNNQIGVPLTLLATPSDTEVVVAEVGTNIPGEVAEIAAICEPDAAIITSVSAEHLEGLGSLDGVLREETSIVSWLPAGAPAVVTDEPAALAERVRALHDAVTVAGTGSGAPPEARGSQVALDGEGRVSFTWRGRQVQLQLRGRHNAGNALLALELGQAWGVDPDAAVAALRELPASAMRGEMHRYGSLTVVADCYNANPGSTAAALELLVGLPRVGGRVAVLGSMLEMGAESDAVHAEAARQAAAHDVDLIVATGAFVAAFEPLRDELGERLLTAADAEAVWEPLSERLGGTETVLLKGSRGVALERLLPRLEQLGMGVLHPHGEAHGPRASMTRTGERDEAHPAERPHPGTSAGAGGATDTEG